MSSRSGAPLQPAFVKTGGNEVNIKEIQRRVNRGFYLIKRDAILHAVKEGFTRQDMIDAILSGRVIEEYPDRNSLPDTFH